MQCQRNQINKGFSSHAVQMRTYVFYNYIVFGGVLVDYYFITDVINACLIEKYFSISSINKTFVDKSIRLKTIEMDSLLIYL